MAERRPFLLRLDPALFDALQRWANDEVRSLNGQVEYLLTRALRDAGRIRTESRIQDRESGIQNARPKAGSREPKVGSPDS